MKRVFVDTNVVIALTFIINSLHSNAEKVFDEYSEIYNNISKFSK